MKFTDGLRDCLGKAFTHILRNSLDHGIETADERLRHGKAAAGEIRITIEENDDGTFLKFKDDGRGLNLQKIANLAKNSGLLEDDASANDIAQLIFKQGMSTASEVTQYSGRGVGMDAVKSFLTDFGCEISIDLEKNGGDGKFAKFEFSIRLPEKAYVYKKPQVA